MRIYILTNTLFDGGIETGSSGCGIGSGSTGGSIETSGSRGGVATSA